MSKKTIVVGTGITTLKSLQDLKVPGMDWKQVQQLLTDGKACARRKSWPTGDFMFCHQGSSKYINEKTTAGLFYWPLTFDWMKKHKWTILTIQSHYNRVRYSTKILQVGFFPSAEDRDNNDWEFYIP